MKKITNFTKVEILLTMALVIVVVSFVVVSKRYFSKSSTGLTLNGFFDAADLELKDKKIKKHFNREPKDNPELARRFFNSDFFTLKFDEKLRDVEYKLPIKKTGMYQLFAFLARGPEFGIVRFSVGKEILGAMDLYSRDLAPTLPMYLGKVKISKKNPYLKVEVFSRNLKTKTKELKLAIDGIQVLEVPAVAKSKVKKAKAKKS